MDSIQKSYAIVNWWNKLPIWISSILTGFFVSTLGVLIWVATATLIPAPYSIVIMAIILILYVFFFSGTVGAKKSQKFRGYCFRAIIPERSASIVILATLSLLVFFNTLLVFTFRLIPFQPETFKTATFLDGVPVGIVWPFIIIASLVAGICEETGFRGYMQKPMEGRYGVIKSILITSIVFVIVHLHQAWAGGVLFHIFLISVLLGILTYTTDSLLPGIVVHTAFDVVNFSYWWSNVAGTFSHSPVSETGIDLHFILTSAVGAISLLLFLYTTKKLIHAPT